MRAQIRCIGSCDCGSYDRAPTYFDNLEDAKAELEEAGKGFAIFEVTWGLRWYGSDGKPWDEGLFPYRGIVGVAERKDAKRFDSARDARESIRPEGRPGFGGDPSGYRVVRFVKKVEP